MYRTTCISNEIEKISNLLWPLRKVWIGVSWKTSRVHLLVVSLHLLLSGSGLTRVALVRHVIVVCVLWVSLVEVRTSNPAPHCRDDGQRTLRCACVLIG